jgi:hypothetical protein
MSSADLGLSTLPEKCVWGKDSVTAYCGSPSAVSGGAYPDVWYQGVTHFNDGIWKVDTKGGVTTQINDGGGNYVDVTKPILNKEENYLFFVNKNDRTPWSVKLVK